MSGRSFTRAGGDARGGAVGTKPSLHGQTVVSTGIQELDQLLRGGVALGTLLLLLEDSWAPSLHQLLLAHYLAQGTAHGQPLVYASSHPVPAEFLASLPSTAEGKSEKEGQERRGPGVAEQAGDNLRIAWQYRRFLTEQQALEERRQRQRDGISAAPRGAANEAHPARAGRGAAAVDFCNSFDVKKPVGRRPLQPGSTCCSVDDLTTLHSYCSALLDRLAALPPDSMQVGRIVLHGFAGPSASSSEWQQLAFLQSLKGLLRARPLATALVTIPAGLASPAFLARAQHVADTVLVCQGVSEDDTATAAMFVDFQEVQGLLHLRRLPSLNTQVPAIPEESTVAVRVIRRRRVTLERLHLGPDEEEVPGSGTSKGASGLLCGRPANAASPLDF